MADSRPPSEVLGAFGATGTLVPLHGGQSTAWRAGNVVLKMLDTEPEFVEWLDRVLAHQVRSSHIRLSRPLRAQTGDFVADGWTAWTHVDGDLRTDSWDEVIRAGEAFSSAFRQVAAPSLLTSRESPWAVADRVAWGEERLPGIGRVPHIARLLSVLMPVPEVPQLIHGDLTGNVLHHPTLPPAVIDHSLYWRPVPYGSAIVVVDALTFHGAAPALVDALPDTGNRAQYLARALLFRLVTDHLRGARPPHGTAGTDPYAAIVERVCRLVSDA